MLKLRGAVTAMITPMLSDGSVDYEGFKKNINFQLENGIDCLCPLGTTAETPTLDEDEEEKLIELVISEVKAFEKKSGKKVPVILGAGSNNTRDAVRYCQRAKDMGADCALVVTPYYNKPSDEGVFAHFEAVSKVGIPILVYNIQGRTGRNIQTSLLKRIAALPNICGVKEASGNISQMMDVIAEIKSEKPDFAVLSGDDGLTVPLIAMGGDGIISVVTNMMPKPVVEMTHLALDGKIEEARKIHYKLLPFFKAAFVEGNPTSIKAAINMYPDCGAVAGALRLPLVDVTDAGKAVIKAAIEKVNK